MGIDQAVVKNRVSESCRGPQAQLANAVRHGAAQLLGRQDNGTGKMTVYSDASDAKLVIDGGNPLALPLKSPITNLSAGKHSISVTADGFYALHRDVYVQNDQLTQIRTALIGLPSPWDKKWWVWTAVGVAAVGAVSSSIIFAPKEPETASVQVAITQKP